MKPALLLAVNTQVFSDSIELNGFDTSQLQFQNGLGPSYAWLEGAGTIDRALLIHPYFLRGGKNEVVLHYKLEPDNISKEDAGPWSIGVAISETPSDNQFHPASVLQFARSTPLKINKADMRPQDLKMSFNWEAKMPMWSWTKAHPIKKTEENKLSLYREYVQFLAELLDPAKNPERKSKAIASTKEFIQASELYGKKYIFIDQLFQAAKSKTVQDEYNTVWNLELQPLKDVKDIELVVFADGALAKLNTSIFLKGRRRGGEGRGAGGEAAAVDLEASLWFRKNAKEEWELDAIYPESGTARDAYY